jgi:hypothetical protein
MQLLSDLVVPPLSFLFCYLFFFLPTISPDTIQVAYYTPLVQSTLQGSLTCIPRDPLVHFAPSVMTLSVTYPNGFSALRSLFFSTATPSPATDQPQGTFFRPPKWSGSLKIF